MKKIRFFVLAILISISPIFSQNADVEGYVFEDGNRGYLNQVILKIYDGDTKDYITSTRSDKEGFFSLQLESDKAYQLEAVKDIFQKKTLTFKTESAGKTFLKVPMLREEGYLFEVTLAPKRDSEDEVVDAITGALIEVYNNTTQEEVAVMDDHPTPDFKIHFKKGNHYTVMVRKEGYLVKRMEAFVNVEGCILCFEGVGEVKPGVADNLTEGMSMGTLLANVEMEPIYEGKIIELQNVYYEFGKSELTRQGKENLRNLGAIMKDNPHLNVELGSHTDVRGTGPDNRSLSERRAQAAVDYLTKEMGIDADRIVAVGYGESQIKNKCKPGVTCTEEEHAENRRTEIKILEMDDGGLPMQSLASMKVEEQFMKQLMEGEVEQVSFKEKDNQLLDPDDTKLKERQTDGVITDQSEKAISGADVSDNRDEEALMKKLEVAKEKERVQEKLEKERKKETTEEVKEEVRKSAVVKHKSYSKGVEVGSKEMDDGRQAEKNDVVKELISKRKEKNATEGYSGYRVVIHFSNFPISGDHPIYDEFEEVETYRTDQKNLLYMVGGFENEELAEEWRKNNISEKYPNSYVAGFINGKRVKIEE